MLSLVFRFDIRAGKDWQNSDLVSRDNLFDRQRKEKQSGMDYALLHIFMLLSDLEVLFLISQL